MAEENKGTFYRTDADNPSGVEWLVTVKETERGYSIDLSNTANQAVASTSTGTKR